MSKCIKVKFHDGWSEIVAVPDDMPTHKVIEKMQRNRRRMSPHRSDACTYQVLEARDIVSAIIEANR